MSTFLQGIWVTWASLRDRSVEKGPHLQYEEYSDHYTIFIVESGLIRWTEVWKDGATLPVGVDAATNAANLADWTAQYLPLANLALHNQVTITDGDNPVSVNRDGDNQIATRDEELLGVMKAVLVELRLLRQTMAYATEVEYEAEDI